MQCIGYNLISNFYIILNLMFPFYSQDIVNLQYKTIQNVNEEVVFKNNSRKRKRFNMFVDNLMSKNGDIIEKIRQKEEEDNNLDNYEKIYHEDSQDDSHEDSQEDSQED